MVKAKKFVAKKKFQGIPKRDDFEVVEYELPPLKQGEILVKAEWIGVDPFIRLYNQIFDAPYDQFSFQVGLVQASKNPKYPMGSRVVHFKGWCDFAIIDEKTVEPYGLYSLPDIQGLPVELCVGALGMPGVTAYFGLLEICKPKSGETVVVTGAAGAVGAVVGQIAKIKGCRVVGLAGSDDKVEYLEKELGFDKAINYKTADIQSALKAAAPNGVDCFFDNVGGETSSIIINQMNEFGRMAVCGAISSYNNQPDKATKTTDVQMTVLLKQITIQGFVVYRWSSPVNRWPEAFADLIMWIKNGQIKTKSHVTEGFENLFDAFIDLLGGKNFGKSVVKV